MGVLDFFRPVSAMPAEEIRALINEKKTGEYNLVDVRQPQEYESGHLPGAKLIPVGELETRLKELDPDKPTIAY